MDITIGTQLLGPSQAGRTDAERRADAERLKVAELSREFEASLLVQLVRQMRQSLLDEEEQSEGLGNAALTDTLDVELSRQLAAQGGIGLARIVQQALEPRQSDNPGPAAIEVPDASTRNVGISTPEGLLYPADAPALPAAPPPITPPDAVGGPREKDANLTLPLAAPVSSAFGWRADPFHGVRKFHAGMDFRAAYGREVPSAGAGRVVAAGEQGAYGLTVVIDHGGGMQTRYAHLSSIDAAVGEQLAQGQVVGRVGQSGRATGPHLHFEVLLDGQRVDPIQMARRLPDGLKNLTADDDYAFDRASAEGPANGVTNEN